MEHFVNGRGVRLRCRVRGMYICANDDGVGVFLSPHRATLSAAWMVRRVELEGATYVGLHSAAYGRYLTFGPVQPDRGGRRRVVQRDYDAPEQDVTWRLSSGGNGTHDVVVLTQGTWCLGEPPEGHWVVNVLIPRPHPPDLPAPPPIRHGQIGVPELRRRRHAEPVVSSRMIRYVMTDGQGNFNPTGWRTIQFFGRSVYNLRRELAVLLGRNVNSIVLCVRAGSRGWPTHLVVDLPRSEEPMSIVVLPANSEADRSLQHPDVDGP